jgi:hypothetical protein
VLIFILVVPKRCQRRRPSGNASSINNIIQWPGRAMSITHFIISHCQFRVFLLLTSNLDISRFQFRVFLLPTSSLGISYFQFGYFYLPNFHFILSELDISYFQKSRT